MSIDFVYIWTLILGVAVFLYVLLDGFDLGVGILYGFAPNRAVRTLMMNSIAPVWDGNETWLVMGGVGLFAAFPLAFSIIIPAVYFPILIMLLALVFRGVAFEFHFRDAHRVTFWDRAFNIGSIVATFAQGIVLGSFVQGFAVENKVFSGHSYDCFTPFSIFTGFALVFGYALLGAGWLILKTQGELQDRARQQGKWCFWGITVSIIIVSIWTPFIDPKVAARWFVWPNIAYLSPVPIITSIISFYLWKSLNNKGAEFSPFILTILLFVMSYVGLAVSIFPMIVPYHFTLREAASSFDTQAFLLVGTLFLLPIILMYSAWSYWVFRGKVRADVGYHH